MLELGISQAQTQFTKLLNQTVLIIDKKAHNKKAVILPYDEYLTLVARATNNKKMAKGGMFSKFIGILDNDFKTSDIKYNELVN